MGAREDFTVVLEAWNGDGTKSLTMMRLKVNKPPVNGSCSVEPTYGVFGETDFKFYCDDYVDPENIGIASYAVSCRATQSFSEYVNFFSFFSKIGVRPNCRFHPFVPNGCILK